MLAETDSATQNRAHGSVDQALGPNEPLSGSSLNFRKFQVSDYPLAIKTATSSRDDPTNIIGDVYIGKDRKSRTVRNKKE